MNKVIKYNIKGKKFINSPFKVYFEDVGVRNARLNFNQIEESRLVENIIYNELKYHGFKVEVGEVEVNQNTGKINCSGKTIYVRKSLEVDFIATKGNQRIYLQSSLYIYLMNLFNCERNNL